MQIEQVAMAVVNDPDTEQTRLAALATWLAGRDSAAVHMLLVPVFAELRKPIYEGVQFDGSSWQAAARVLNWHIDCAIAEREGGAA
jgi:hypothetical protein